MYKFKYLEMSQSVCTLFTKYNNLWCLIINITMCSSSKGLSKASTSVETLFKIFKWKGNTFNTYIRTCVGKLSKMIAYLLWFSYKNLTNILPVFIVGM